MYVLKCTVCLHVTSFEGVCSTECTDLVIEGLGQELYPESVLLGAQRGRLSPAGGHCLVHSSGYSTEGTVRMLEIQPDKCLYKSR